MIPRIFLQINTGARWSDNVEKMFAGAFNVVLWINRESELAKESHRSPFVGDSLINCYT